MTQTTPPIKANTLASALLDIVDDTPRTEAQLREIMHARWPGLCRYSDSARKPLARLVKLGTLQASTPRLSDQTTYVRSGLDAEGPRLNQLRARVRDQLAQLDLDRLSPAQLTALSAALQTSLDDPSGAAHGSSTS